MNSSDLVYNLIIMKKTILLLLSVVLFSGCANPIYKKIELGDPGSYEKIRRGYVQFKGDELNLANLNEFIPVEINKNILEYCQNYKITAIEKKPYVRAEYWFLLFLPWSIYPDYENNLNLIHFECIYEKK